MLSQAFNDIVEKRRSNRSFDLDIHIPDEVVKKSLERAILSPNSSNMQLWEFYRITSQELKSKLVPLCFNQSAAKTADQFVVFVTRQDLWKQRASWNKETLLKVIPDDKEKYKKRTIQYYGKLMPMAYRNDPFGFWTLVRKSVCFAIGLFRPIVQLGGKADQRVVLHKSCALAAQTFMLSITAEGFDSCPMEGFDQRRVKKLLQLPPASEINMIIGIGKGTEGGIHWPRFRVPYDEVVFEK
ncbi:MAG: nitroreductase family protein [Chitinophagaceae bacterium]